MISTTGILSVLRYKRLQHAKLQRSNICRSISICFLASQSILYLYLANNNPLLLSKPQYILKIFHSSSKSKQWLRLKEDYSYSLKELVKVDYRWILIEYIFRENMQTCKVLFLLNLWQLINTRNSHLMHQVHLTTKIHWTKTLHTNGPALNLMITYPQLIA